MLRLSQELRSALKRLEHEIAVWREEPLKMVTVRNNLLRPLRARQFYSFGQHSLIDRPIWLYGSRSISVGDQVIILRGAWLSVERVAWGKPAPVFKIGTGVGIRTGFTASAAESIEIEDHVGMGGNVTVVDSKHTWSGGHPNPNFNPVDSAPVRIGRGSWLADRVTVAAGSDIGEQCAIGSNTTVSGKVPDFSIVLGNPGRVVGSTRT
jgi:acetyltransferase-like isoleucine patch superfamily enzyme